MDPEEIKAERIFKAAIALESPEERSVYIEEACAEDPNLQARVESLLRAHKEASQAAFLESPPLEPEMTLESTSVQEVPGMIFGRYTLLEKIGEGGMAVVYMAEQKRPLRRKVALKIIKLGMDSRRVLGEDHPETLRACVYLGTLYNHLSRHQEAEALLESTYRTTLRVLGEEHLVTNECMNMLAAIRYEQNRADEAEMLAKKALDVGRRLEGPGHPRIINLMCNLGLQYTQQGRYHEAQTLLEGALEEAIADLGSGHRATVYCMTGLAFFYQHQRRYTEAETWQRQAWEIRRHQTPNQPDWINPGSRLALILYAQGRFEEAEPILRRELEINRRCWSSEHRSSLDASMWLALLYMYQGHYHQAESMLCKNLPVSVRLLGSKHYVTLSTQAFLRLLYVLQDKYADLETLYLDRITQAQKTHSHESASLATAVHDLAWLYATFPAPELRKADQAMHYAMQACELSDWQNANYISTLAAAHAENEDMQTAIEYQQQAIDLFRSQPSGVPLWPEERLKRYQSGFAWRSSPLPLMVGSLLKVGWPLKMEPCLRKAWETCCQHLSPYHRETWRCERQLMEYYLIQNQPNQLKTFLDELHAVHTQLPPRPEGTLSYNQSKDCFSLTAAGADIWSAVDEFLFVPKMLQGDGAITARIDSIEQVNQWSKAGLMIRNTLDPSSVHATVYLTPSNKAVLCHRAAALGSTTNRRVSFDGVTFPHWVRLKREGERFWAQHSRDGEHWEEILAKDPNAPAYVNVPMNDRVYIGLALSPHISDQTVRAQISHVRVTGDVESAGPFTESIDVNLRMRKDESGGI